MDARMKKRAQVAARRRRVRARIRGTADCPRLSVFRSSAHTYVQLIDDAAGVTLVGAWDGEVVKKEMKESKESSLHRRVTVARAVGALLAERAQAKKIKRAVFDRGSAAYHGRVAAVAEGARAGGLEF